MIRWAGPRVAKYERKSKVSYRACFRAFMLCHMMSSSVRYSNIVPNEHKYKVYIDLMKSAKRWIKAWKLYSNPRRRTNERVKLQSPKSR